MKSKTSKPAHKKPDSRLIITVMLSVVLAVSGMHHGFFEILQGNTPTNSLFIDSIGELHKRWVYGGDGAFTLIPNFLATGIVSILISVLIVLWSIFHIKSRYGVIVLLLLFVLLTLAGGGIGHIPFFLIVTGYATTIKSRLEWWKKMLNGRAGNLLSKTWFYATAASGVLFLAGLEISVFGYVPNVSDPEKILAFCWSSLFASLLLINYSFIAGFAYDIKNNSRNKPQA